MISAGSFQIVKTSIGKKVVMSATGTLMALFVIGHMIGNLQIFWGPERLNAYAAALKSMPALLWSVRLVMFVTVLVHAMTGLLLIFAALRARPVGYAKQRFQQASLSSRTMFWTGPILAAYIIYHLLDQTIGSLHPQFDAQNVYQNVVIGFSRGFAAAAYIISMLVLFLHLKHGLWSLLQTLGLINPQINPTTRKTAFGLALLLMAGFIMVPAGVLSGIVT